MAASGSLFGRSNVVRNHHETLNCSLGMSAKRIE